MKKKKVFKVLGIIAIVIVGYYLAVFIGNRICNRNLCRYIESFEKVSYEDNRPVPKMEDGHYTFTTDEEFTVMHLTDIHIGGGIYSYKRDKKAIYEVITMLQKEKPDLVILGGDNTYCVSKIGYNGGGCFDNGMVARTVINIFNHEGVYFSTVFGNHDTESIDTCDRQEIGDVYMDPEYEYCIFNQEFTDGDADTVPSISNQFIVLKNTSGEITKLIMLMDSNAYESTSMISSILGKYDVIHDSEVEWAKETITDLSKKQGLPEGEYLKTIAFFHIPIGEFRTALDDLICENKDEEGNIISFEQKTSSADTEYIEGSWGEKLVCFGGLKNTSVLPENQDMLFESLCDDMHSLEAVFCGHDHLNSAVVKYKGVILDYGYSIDNIAYGNDISNSGLQRGATVITINSDGKIDQVHKNAYIDYGCDTDIYVPVYLDHVMKPDEYRTVTK